jgi:hypothetical protein
VFNILKTSVLARLLVALAIAGGAIAAAVPFATGATLTYTNLACTSYTLSGTAPNQTLTCVTSGGGAGGTVPTCAPTAKPSSPAIGQSTTISANCDSSPTSWAWSGGGCLGITSPTCTVVKSKAVGVTYSVQATNASGTGNTASITVLWH